ncbi:acetylcholinesterase precursor [Truncatella angustata]|uniref:Carboxylic ester hydrolase n=1 Tax=Truncatella angustata TaxID=152316 RepID=A0A9P8UML8_9PEZI|nr:acetylcholinesterase precursor [Truncatella angustata]KAH6654742.1 acetylcholinesterase precursor [Truncatella angustata]
MYLRTLIVAGLASLIHANSKDLTIDLGYETYTGVHNQLSGLNIWRGIRYAAAPIGDLRFRGPVEPEITGNSAQADNFGPPCFQSTAIGVPYYPPNAIANEDCLFLNIYAPDGAKDLPVYVYIHGGGYGLGDGRQDLSALINENENSFLGVSLNYRLGALGFLSSEDVKENGVLNAGLLDQQFALEWIQKNIHLFGGNKSEVTIYGISAGAGSVLHHSLAYGGTQGNKLFKNGMAASPWLSRQYKYNDDFPTSLYEQFARLSGCGEENDKLSCLRGKDNETLQRANNETNYAGPYGWWSFTPVIDGSFIQSLPSQQLFEKKEVNGQNMWVSYNADESPWFVPRTVATEEDLLDLLHVSFPHFDEDDIASILEVYSLSEYGKNSSNPRLATAGDSGPTAVDVSPFAIGNQQRAYVIIAESSYHCPSYWLASSFTEDSAKSSYVHTYTNPPALHGLDLYAYLGQSDGPPSLLGQPLPNQGPDFAHAWRRMLGAYIKTGSPNIPCGVAKNPHSDVLSNWPKWGENRLVNFNQTGGTPTLEDVLGLHIWNITINNGPGLENAFREVDAETWEGGRGKRCDFWKHMASKVPM